MNIEKAKKTLLSLNIENLDIENGPNTISFSDIESFRSNNRLSLIEFRSYFENNESFKRFFELKKQIK